MYSMGKEHLKHKPFFKIPKVEVVSKKVWNVSFKVLENTLQQSSITQNWMQKIYPFNTNEWSDRYNENLNLFSNRY